jgi:hypothetical protein
METWLFFLVLAVLSTAIGIYRSIKRPVSVQASKQPKEEIGGSMAFEVSVPSVWDEKAISRQLDAAQTQPRIVFHYIGALQQRFILRTEDRTAQYRTRFLRTHIEHLELGKQYRTLVNDLKAMEAEQNNRLLRLDLERHELEVKNQHTDALEKLRLEKECLAIKLEIEELKARKRAIAQPPQEEPNLTPEQQRRLKRIEIEDRIEQLDRQEEAALRKARDEEARVRIQNMYTDKREELRDQLSKNLV